MKYAFIAANQDQFKTRPMCRMLGVHPSGFYAWVKEPLSQRVLEDERQTELIKTANVSGYLLQDRIQKIAPS